MSSSKPKPKYISQQILNPSIELSKRFSFKHPHLFKTINPNIPSLLYFEYASITLSQLIAQRRPTKLFIERDILALLRGISSALAYLQINSVSHGNINSNRVFFDENHGIFKIYDEELLLGENQAFYEAKTGRRAFLSPEIINFYRNPQIYEIRGNLYKTDVFALGLVALEAATLKPSEEIYEKGSLTINAAKIDERLIFLMKHYSRELVHVIRMMLEIDEDVRPDPCELYSILGGTESTLQPFKQYETGNQKENLQNQKENQQNFKENQVKTKENQQNSSSVDLKKSWDSLESMYKSHGLQKIVTKDHLRKSFCGEEGKKIFVYQKQGTAPGKKILSNSCIFTNGLDKGGKNTKPGVLTTNNVILNNNQQHFYV